MSTVLVDSDVLIEVCRARDVKLLQRWQDLAASNDTVLCSPVTIAELWHGARPSEAATLEVLFDSLICVPADHDIGRWAGEYLRTYHRSHGVEIADALIAAT